MGKIRNLLARVIVDIVNKSGCNFKILGSEYATNVEHLQEFGFASVKPDDVKANGIAIFYNGNRGNRSLLVLEVPSLKPDLSAGESALFNAFDAIVKLDKEGIVQLNGVSNDGLIKIQELTDKLNAHILEYNTHVHSISGSNTLVPSTLAQPFVKSDYENTKVVH